MAKIVDINQHAKKETPETFAQSIVAAAFQEPEKDTSLLNEVLRNAEHILQYKINEDTGTPEGFSPITLENALQPAKNLSFNVNVLHQQKMLRLDYDGGYQYGVQFPSTINNGQLDFYAAKINRELFENRVRNEYSAMVSALRQMGQKNETEKPQDYLPHPFETNSLTQLLASCDEVMLAKAIKQASLDPMDDEQALEFIKGGVIPQIQASYQEDKHTVHLDIPQQGVLMVTLPESVDAAFIQERLPKINLAGHTDSTAFLDVLRSGDVYHVKGVWDIEYENVDIDALVNHAKYGLFNASYDPTNHNVSLHLTGTPNIINLNFKFDVAPERAQTLFTQLSDEVSQNHALAREFDPNIQRFKERLANPDPDLMTSMQETLDEIKLSQEDGVDDPSLDKKPSEDNVVRPKFR